MRFRNTHTLSCPTTKEILDTTLLFILTVGHIPYRVFCLCTCTFYAHMMRHLKCSLNYNSICKL